jgi:hypothetical protein
MKKLIAIAFIAVSALSTGLATSSASANSRAYNGYWVNMDRNTSGITRMMIRARGGHVVVRTYGKCHPRDCSWGAARGRAFGPNIATSPATSARAVLIEYRQSHARILLLVQRLGHGRLRVTSFTTFIDGSRRHSYTKTYIMRRARGHHRPHRRS